MVCKSEPWIPFRKRKHICRDTLPFFGENKFYYSAEEGYKGELFILNREQTEDLLRTEKISYMKKIDLKDEGMVKFNIKKTGFYTFVIKNTSGKDSDFEYSVMNEGDVKDCIRRSLYIAVLGIIIMFTGFMRDKRGRVGK